MVQAIISAFYQRLIQDFLLGGGGGGGGGENCMYAECRICVRSLFI